MCDGAEKAPRQRTELVNVSAVALTYEVNVATIHHLNFRFVYIYVCMYVCMHDFSWLCDGKNEPLSKYKQFPYANFAPGKSVRNDSCGRVDLPRMVCISFIWMKNLYSYVCMYVCMCV